MKSKISYICLILSLIITLVGCKNTTQENISSDTVGGNNISKNTYEQISQEKAKELIDSENNYIILDVRTQEEYDEGHIPDAILVPYTDIDENISEILIDKNQLILVYCRSGNRSKIASQSLADLGYTNVKEFGGINTWTYEIEN